MLGFKLVFLTRSEWIYSVLNKSCFSHTNIIINPRLIIQLFFLPLKFYYRAFLFFEVPSLWISLFPEKCINTFFLSFFRVPQPRLWVGFEWALSGSNYFWRGWGFGCVFFLYNMYNFDYKHWWCKVSRFYAMAFSANAICLLEWVRSRETSPSTPDF